MLNNPATSLSRFISFSRDEWAGLRASTPLPLTEADLATLRGLNEPVSLDEVADAYLPLSRLLNLYVGAMQSLYKATDTFLGNLPARVPYIIGVAGSVAVGKSTMSRVLRALLSRWPDHPKTELITTDGFLHSTKVLEERGLMHRKGFPESYDQRRLVRFLTDVKSGAPEVAAPVYSHLKYDIVEGEQKVIRRPDILIVEGLNVLQTGDGTEASRKRAQLFVSDFFDFSIYIDADEQQIENWYVARFLKLCETVFANPDSYFHRYATLSEAEAIATARRIWHPINGTNLADNIGPTKERASLILRKGPDHRIEQVRLRRL